MYGSVAELPTPGVPATTVAAPAISAVAAGIAKVAVVPPPPNVTSAAGTRWKMLTGSWTMKLVWPVTNPVPVTTTVLPPATGPAAGSMDDRVGTSKYVNVAGADSPAIGAVAVTSTGPGPAPGGVVNVSCAALITLTSLAGIVVPPTVIVVWPTTNPLPVALTLVPPPVGPKSGSRSVIVGGGM